MVTCLLGGVVVRRQAPDTGIGPCFLWWCHASDFNINDDTDDDDNII